MTTVKLDSFQNEMRKALKRDLLAQGGHLLSFPDERVTVLVRPSAGPDSNFCQVSIAYCDEGDTFRRKIGEFLVLHRFEYGQFFPVPLNGRSNQAVAAAVCDMLIG